MSDHRFSPRNGATSGRLVRAVMATTMALGVGGAGGSPAAANAVNGCGALASPNGRIGNTVFVDSNDSGVFDSGEAGVDGVGVELWADDGDGVFEPGAGDGVSALCTTTTSAGGHYWFYDVATGNYFVALPSAPADHHSSTGRSVVAGTDHSDDGDPSSSYASVSDLIVFTPGSTPTGETSPVAGDDEADADAASAPFVDDRSDLTVDFGFEQCLGVGNRVWLDADNSGTADLAEPGIDGVTLALYAATVAGAPTGVELATTTTVDGGYYMFPCQDAGDFVVIVTASNFGAGRPLAGMRSGVDGTAGTDAQDDGLDPTMSGDRVVSRMVTVANAAAPTAEPDKPIGTSWRFDGAADDANDTTIDFGFVGLSLGNKVWNDTSTPNGIQDAGEPGIPGVTVQLWSSDGTNPTGTVPLDTVVTGTNGYYRFASLAPGTYVVRIPAANFSASAILDGWLSTPGNGAAPDADANPLDRDDNGDAVGGPGTDVATAPLLLTSAAEPTGETDITGVADAEPSDASANMTVDFGFVDPSPSPTTASLGDRVWIDSNRNGLQDPGEPSVVSARLALLDPNGAQLATTQTDANGLYQFPNLAPGSYRVCIEESTLPVGNIPVAGNQGADDAVDSDFDVDGCTGLVLVGAGLADIDVDLGVAPALMDLGVTKTGTWSASRDEITWSIVVRNLGTQREPGALVVTDIIPAGLGMPAVTAPPGTNCTYDSTSRQISCSTNDDLDPGGTLAITVITTRTSSALCNVSNTVTVRGTGVEASSANNVATAALSGLCSASAASPNTPTQSSGLPRTGSSLALVAMATMLAGVGWLLTLVSQANRRRLPGGGRASGAVPQESGRRGRGDASPPTLP